jgi:hypothetical protein
MKKVKSLLIIFTAILLIGVVAAEACVLDVSMINQDPYPAIPGDYVKVVFQIDGLANPNCGVVNFQVKEEFPFSVDPSSPNPIEVRSGTYSRKYSSFYIAPYKIRVNENALDGNTPIEVAYTTGSSAAEILKEFNIYVENSRADFEIYIKDYDSTTRTLTFEILNIADVDVKALTLEIPKQESIEVKGANRQVVGDLDSNEYTSADFEVILPQGESDITLNIVYTDTINVRREITKNVVFDSTYFNGLERDQKKQPYWLYGLIAVVVIWFIWRRIVKARKKKKMEHAHKH